MRWFLSSVCLAFACLLLTAGPASAHRVTIFAYVDGADIVTESAFSRSARVKQGLVEVFDAVTGDKVLEGRTGDDGIFRFPAPETGRGHGLRIHINAGEGHQNDWIMDPAELEETVFAALSGPPPLSADTPAAVAPTSSPSPVPGGWATPEDVERIVDAALNARLEPVYRLLARQSGAGPGLADIIGGIGWILGLAGMAAYFRRRH